MMETGLGGAGRRPLLSSRGGPRVRSAVMEAVAKQERSPLAKAIEAIEPDYAMANASLVAAVLYQATSPMTTRDIGEAVMGAGYDVSTLRNFSSRALRRIRQRDGVVSLTQDSLAVSMTQAFKDLVTEVYQTREAAPVTATADEAVVFLGVPVPSDEVARAVAIRREGTALGRAGDVSASRAFRAAPERLVWEKLVHEAAFAAGRDGNVPADEEDTLARFERADAAEAEAVPDPVGTPVADVTTEGAPTATVPGPVEAVVVPEYDGTTTDTSTGSVAIAAVAVDVFEDYEEDDLPLPPRVAAPRTDEQEHETAMPSTQTSSAIPTDAARGMALREAREEAAESLHEGLTLVASAPVATGALTRDESAEVDARVASVRASLRTLADRKARESRARVSAAVLEGIADLVRELTSQGVAMPEIREAVRSGGFDLPEGYAAD